MNNRAKVKGQSCLEGRHLTKEGENKPVQWAELHNLFLEVMEVLNRTRGPLSGFLDSGVMANGQVIVWQMAAKADR